MCFSRLSNCEPCEICARRHPCGLNAQCLDWAVARETQALGLELALYLRSPEARFFEWLAERAPR